MKETDAVRMLSALGSPTRIRVFAILCRVGRAGMASGDIAEAVGVHPNLMSSHLAVLQRAGIIAKKKAGRLAIYNALPDLVVELGGYLDELSQFPCEDVTIERPA